MEQYFSERELNEHYSKIFCTPTKLDASRKGQRVRNTRSV